MANTQDVVLAVQTRPKRHATNAWSSASTCNDHQGGDLQEFVTQTLAGTITAGPTWTTHEMWPQEDLKNQCRPTGIGIVPNVLE